MSSISRFFVEANAVGDSTVMIDSPEDVHHIKDVLRLKPGDTIIVSDSDRWEYTCSISLFAPDHLEAKIEDKQSFSAEPAVSVTLFQGIPKSGKMDIIVQKLTELGIARIVPVFMDRSVVRDNGKYNKKVERYRTIAAQAAKQCGRGKVPFIEDAQTFGNAIHKISYLDHLIFPYENEMDATIKDVLKSYDDAPRQIGVIIGPEGGFSETEVKDLDEIGAERVSLGKTTLRTETAGIVAVSMIMYELEL